MHRRIIALLSFLLLSSLPLSAALTGVVMNSDGQPVASAKVSLFAPETFDARRARLLSTEPEAAPLATTQTDSKGNFRFDVPKERPVVDLRIYARGYAPAAATAERDDDLGAVVVHAATTKNGSVTAAGKPVANARVIWTGPAGEFIATTDAQGKYSVPDPARWSAFAVVVHPDYALLDESRGPLRSNRQPKLDFILDAGTALSGRVMAADGQTPAAKAQVTVDGWPVATTGEDGTFTIAHSPKRWDAVVVRSGNLLAQRAHAEGALTFRLTKAATVSGTVRDARTQFPVAAANIRVTAGMMRGDRTVVASAVTDAKGNYSIAVPAGSYQLMVDHPAYQPDGPSVSVMAGQNASRPIASVPLARVTGTVIDDDKAPVAAAAITMSGDGGMRMRGPLFMNRGGGAYSAPDGRFVLRVPGDTDLQVAAAKKGLPPAKSARMHLAAGERKGGVVVTIPRGIAVTGRVTDADHRPLSGVAVSVAEVEPTGGMAFRRMIISAFNAADDDQVVRTASDGTFSMQVKQGTFDFTFRREGFAAKVLRGQEIAPGVQPLDVTLEPGAEVTGRVTRGGVPVANAEVATISPGGFHDAVTGPDGSFRIGDLTPGQAMLTVSKPEEFIDERRNVTVPTRDLNIELPRGARLSGRVVDKATHQPVTTFQAGISGVRAGGGMIMAGPSQMRSFTSDDGSFTLENLPAGPLQLLVNAPGYASGRLSNLTLEEGKALTGVEVQLDSGSKVSGRVTAPDGAPVSGALVSLVQTLPGRMGRTFGVEGSVTATTDTNGEYTLEAIEAGQKTFSFSHNNYLTQEKSIDVSGREMRLDVQLASGARATGIVTTDAGVPVADAVVRTMGASGMPDSARTDASGAFTLEHVAPGRYTVTASKTGYADATLRDVDLGSGAPLRLTLRSGGVIFGHVTGLDAKELPLTIVEARSADGSATANVDASGNFRIEGAPTGSVRVSASVTSNGFIGQKSSPVQSVQLDPGGSRQVDLEFRTEIVRGRVTRNGQPLANAGVSFVPRSGATTSGRVTTDDNGNYTISGLEDGRYTVQVLDLQRLNRYTTNHDVRGGGTFDIDIKTVPLRGRVTDAGTGEPIGDARVLLRSAEPSEMNFPQRDATTDSSGAFLIDSVSAGRYSATAEKEGYGNQTVDVTVSESSAEPLEFRIARNDGVTLKVVDARDGRLLSASATVTDAEGRVVYDAGMTFGDAPESVRLSLAPGSYRATISAMGYASRTFTIVSPSQQTVGLTPGGTLIIRSNGATRRRGRLIDSQGQPYRVAYRPLSFLIDASPAATTLQNVAPGAYTLQILGDNDSVTNSTQVTVTEGQTTTVEQ